jgi:hypothetical protein
MIEASNTVSLTASCGGDSAVRRLVTARTQEGILSIPTAEFAALCSFPSN